MKQVCLLITTFLLVGCSSQVVRKINGVSFVASREAALQEHVDAVVSVNASHAAVMPFGFIRDTLLPEIIFDTERQWYGETRKGAGQYIELLHANNIKVMLKPQIWIRHGQFTGALSMPSEDDWKLLEASYERFILNYAELAAVMGVELFCVGTELEKFVMARPAFWEALIGKIRNTYKGKLTYAANWDEYDQVPFWEQLDYIGIDAYFPLSQEKTPGVDNLIAAWEPWKVGIRDFSKSQRRQVIFTEFGYRSMDYTARRPWLADREEVPVNLDGQTNAKKAIFETFWREDWFAGGFVWKWFTDHARAGGVGDNRFTPQNKPAQEIIKSYYSAF
jgi:uncharacterized protein YceK